MDSGRALADLLEISPQIEAAAVLSREGELDGSIGVSATRAGDLAQATRELLDRAAAFRSEGGRVTQIHAELGEADVFAVSGADGRTIVALAGRRTAPGLVFYDLKQCLAAVESEDGVGT